MNNNFQKTFNRNLISSNNNNFKNYANNNDYINMNSNQTNKEKCYNEDLIGLKIKPETISKINQNSLINNYFNLNQNIIPKDSSYYSNLIYSVNNDLPINENKYCLKKSKYIPREYNNQIPKTSNSIKLNYSENNKKFLLNKNKEIENRINLLHNHSKKIEEMQNYTNDSTINKNSKKNHSYILNFSENKNYYRTIKPKIAKKPKSKNKNKKNQINRNNFNEISKDSSYFNKKTINKNYSTTFKQKTNNNKINKVNMFYPKSIIKTISLKKRNKSLKSKNTFNDNELYSKNYVENKINEIKSFIEENKNGIEKNLRKLLVLQISELENTVMDEIDKVKNSYEKKIEIKSKKIGKLENENKKIKKIIKMNYNY